MVNFATRALALPVLVAIAFGPSLGLATPLLGSDLASFTVLGASTVTNVHNEHNRRQCRRLGERWCECDHGIPFQPGVPTADPQVTGGWYMRGPPLEPRMRCRLKPNSPPLEPIFHHWGPVSP